MKERKKDTVLALGTEQGLQWRQRATVSNAKARADALAPGGGLDGGPPVIILATCDVEREGRGKERIVGVREFEFEHKWQVACLLSHTTN